MEQTATHDASAAKAPHEIFLLNLLFNRILPLIATISARSTQILVLIVLVLSVGIMGYTPLAAAHTLGFAGIGLEPRSWAGCFQSYRGYAETRH